MRDESRLPRRVAIGRNVQTVPSWSAVIQLCPKPGFEHPRSPAFPHPGSGSSCCRNRFDPTSATVEEIDDRIAAERRLYLCAYWAGHDGEAEFYVIDIALLQRLRIRREAGTG